LKDGKGFTEFILIEEKEKNNNRYYMPRPWKGQLVYYCDICFETKGYWSTMISFISSDKD